jgi:hypothetical protein
MGDKNQDSRQGLSGLVAFQLEAMEFGFHIDHLVPDIERFDGLLLDLMGWGNPIPRMWDP